jgi:hypothetical protein
MNAVRSCALRSQTLLKRTQAGAGAGASAARAEGETLGSPSVYLVRDDLRGDWLATIDRFECGDDR